LKLVIEDFENRNNSLIEEIKTLENALDDAKINHNKSLIS